MLEQPLLFTGCSSIQCTFTKLLPQKNAFSKIVFSENINFIALIYSSSESSEPSEQLPKLSIICLITFFLNVFTVF